MSSELVQGLLSFAHMILPIMYISSGCKCLFVVYASCYESCLVSNNVSIHWMMELWTSLHVLILYLRHHYSWTSLPFLLGRFCINDVVVLVILFSSLNYRHLFFETSLHSSLIVGDYVCNLSYKSNAFVWLETFHKEYSYWQILMHKYMIMQPL